MHPILFEIGSIYVSSREGMLLFAFIVGISIAARRGSLFGINIRKTIELGIYLIISSLVGARLLYVLENLDWYMVHPAKIIFARSGFAFYGGFLFSLGVSLRYLHKHKISFLLMGDIIAPSLAIGEAIGRVGCLLAGCCYGKPTSLPWGIHFPSSSLPYQHFGDIRLHPIQLYFAIEGIFLFLILRRIKPSSKGSVFFLYLMLHSFFRFMIEFFRGDSPYLFLNLTISQVIAIFIGITGVIFLLSKRL